MPVPSPIQPITNRATTPPSSPVLDLNGPYRDESPLDEDLNRFPPDESFSDEDIILPVIVKTLPAPTPEPLNDPPQPKAVPASTFVQHTLEQWYGPLPLAP